MGRLFLKFYVAINIFVVVINIVVNVVEGETIQYLSNDDWLIFIIACGALAISESLEGLHVTNNKDHIQENGS